MSITSLRDVVSRPNYKSVEPSLILSLDSIQLFTLLSDWSIDGSLGNLRKVTCGNPDDTLARVPEKWFLIHHRLRG